MAMLRMPRVKAETGFRSNASIYNAIQAGLFPKPVKIGLRAVGWPEHEVAAVTRARIAGLADEEIRTLVHRIHAQRAQQHGSPGSIAGIPVPYGR